MCLIVTLFYFSTKWLDHSRKPRGQAVAMMVRNLYIKYNRGRMYQAKTLLQVVIHLMGIQYKLMCVYPSFTQSNCFHFHNNLCKLLKNKEEGREESKRIQEEGGGQIGVRTGRAIVEHKTPFTQQNTVYTFPRMQFAAIESDSKTAKSCFNSHCSAVNTSLY